MSKFDKSLYADKPAILTRATRRKGSRNATIEGGEPLTAGGQLARALGDLEASARRVFEREGVSLVGAIAKPGNTTAGRAGRIASGVMAVRNVLGGGDAHEAALAMYRLMQQFAAAAVDEWREEVRRGLDSVDRQRRAAASSKRREGYDAVADYCVRTMGHGLAPRLVWRTLAERKRDIEGRVVRVINDTISCTGYAPITKAVFLKTYLKPAREAAAKG